MTSSFIISGWMEYISNKMATPPPSLLHPMPSYLATTSIRVTASPKTPLQEVVACKHCTNKFRVSTNKIVFCSKECKAMQSFESQWHKKKSIEETPPSNNPTHKMPEFWYAKTSIPRTSTVQKNVSAPCSEHQSMEQQLCSTTTNPDLSSMDPLPKQKYASAPGSDRQSMEQMVLASIVLSSVPTNLELSCPEKINEGTSTTIIVEELVLSPPLSLRTDKELSSGENSHKSGSVYSHKSGSVQSNKSGSMKSDIETPWKNVDSVKKVNVLRSEDPTTVTVTEALSIEAANMCSSSSSSPIIDQSSSDRVTIRFGSAEKISVNITNVTDGSAEIVQPPPGPRPSRCNERPSNTSRRNIQVLSLSLSHHTNLCLTNSNLLDPDLI